MDSCDSIWAFNTDKPSVHFPGALSSKFTSDLAFEHPATHPAMPTYRVMDSDGVVVDKSWKPSYLGNEEVIHWYKDMLTGMSLQSREYDLKATY